MCDINPSFEFQFDDKQAFLSWSPLAFIRQLRHSKFPVFLHKIDSLNEEVLWKTVIRN